MRPGDQQALIPLGCGQWWTDLNSSVMVKGIPGAVLQMLHRPEPHPPWGTQTKSIRNMVVAISISGTAILVWRS